jgi:hypothetical protein
MDSKKRLTHWKNEDELDYCKLHLDYNNRSIRCTNNHILTDDMDHMYLICQDCFNPTQVKAQTTKINRCKEILLSTRCTHCKGKWKPYRRIMTNIKC